MRIYVSIALAVLMLSITTYASPLFPSDSVLGKPVTLAVKGKALHEILPSLEKQTGARLTVSREIEDQKATIFVDAKPLRDVMAGLEPVFRYRWSFRVLNGQRTYELWEPEKVRKEREDRWQKAVDVAYQKLDGQLAAMAKRASEMKPAELKKSMDDAVSHNDRKALDEASTAFDHCYTGLMARACAQLGPDASEAFHQGYRVCLSSTTDEQEWRLPTDITEGVTASFDGMITWGRVAQGWSVQEPHFTGLGLMLSVHTDPSQACARVGSSFLGGGSGASSLDICHVDLLDAVSLPKRTLPRIDDDSELRKTLSWKAEELAEESAVSQRPEASGRLYATRSDVLALLHRKLVLQVISDYYSCWHELPDETGHSVREILESFGRFPGAPAEDLKNLEKPDPTGYTSWRLHDRYGYEADWGWDGQLIYMRSKETVRDDARETPNRLLDRWREVVKLRSRLDLGEFAEIAQLDDEQIRHLAQNAGFLGLSPENKTGIPEPDDRFATYRALRLYGLLSSPQREEAFRGGIPVGSLTPEQYNALRDVLSASVCEQRCIVEPDKPVALLVGIYDQTGQRIDKPGTTLRTYYLRSVDPSEVTSVGMRVGAETNEPTLQPVGGGKTGFRPLHRIGYSMVLTYADGKTSEVPIVATVPKVSTPGGKQSQPQAPK